ncbi:MAG: site-specific DNA-methyltransferase, partial [Nitrospirota bacterium]|nr:site-specific DNA-methyltransferase [Nitrospirota bacterium]
HLVKLTSFENQTVLDPFMGSGSTGLACLELKRKFIGYELDEDYFKIAEQRLDNKQKSQKLF